MHLPSCSLAAALALPSLLSASPEDEAARLKRLEARVAALEDELEQLHKSSDDALWWLRLQDVAEVDKVTYVGPPNPKAEESYGIVNARHPMKIHSYVFIPRKLDRSRKHPLIVLPHGGVHGDFGTYHVHIVREMVARGYVVVAPEYRGSTGYGKGYRDAIDYGGLEVDDVVAGRDWAVEALPFVDGGRCALVGWSHGGMISLLAACDHAAKFKAVYAGVPVSDLLARVGYAGEEYRDDRVVRSMFGKLPTEDVDLVKRRSPVTNVHRLKVPLMVVSTTNDRDVNVVEVEHLLTALKAAGKEVNARIYKDAPGGHSFDRIDTQVARQARQEMFAWLEKQLGN